MSKYIYQCQKKIRPNKTLTDKTLVLDIDETLVHTWDNLHDLTKSKILNHPKFYPVKTQLYVLDFEDDEDDEKLWGIKRPGLDQFLNFAFKYFKNVCVWSAGTPDYVNKIVEQIFSQHPCPDLVFTRENCNMVDNVPSKPLSKLYEALESASHHNTIMIDDRDDVMEINPNNGITIPSYEPSLTNIKELSDDSAFTKIINWLNSPHVINSRDIRFVDKNIFDY